MYIILNQKVKHDHQFIRLFVNETLTLPDFNDRICHITAIKPSQGNRGNSLSWSA
jgi:hypothetical protein